MSVNINIDDKVVIAHLKAVREFAASELNTFGTSAANELEELAASLGDQDRTKKKEFLTAAEETKKARDSIVRELKVYTDSLFEYLKTQVSMDSMKNYQDALGSLEASKAKKGTKWSRPKKGK